MASETRAKITIGDNSVELEGSEEFVSKHLESFRNLLEARTATQHQHQAEKTIEENKQVRGNGNLVSKDNKKARRKIVSPSPEEFDISKSSDTPSLKEFYEQKNPGITAQKRFVVIAYYIQKIKKFPSFTGGQIEFAYKALDLKNRPTNVYQIIINAKNRSSWFEEAENGWKLTRLGEIYVEEKLPEATDKL